MNFPLNKVLASYVAFLNHVMKNLVLKDYLDEYFHFLREKKRGKNQKAKARKSLGQYHRVVSKIHVQLGW
jgi:hypothetical protein